jgi:hypothetical protein
MSPFYLASLQHTPMPRTPAELDHARLLREKRLANAGAPREKRTLSFLRFLAPRFGMLSEG